MVLQVSFEKPHKSEGNKLMWHFDDADLKKLGTLSVEMKLDQFLEHRDMVELLKTNIHQKNNLSHNDLDDHKFQSFLVQYHMELQEYIYVLHVF